MNNLGVVRFLQNDLDSAETLYQSALAVQPEYPEALSNLGTIRRLKGDLDGAISLLPKGFGLAPGLSRSSEQSRQCLRDARRLDEAVVTYEEGREPKTRGCRLSHQSVDGPAGFGALRRRMARI